MPIVSRRRLASTASDRIRPLAVLANLVRLTTGIELIDRVGSRLGLFWTQGVVGARPRQART